MGITFVALKADIEEGHRLKNQVAEISNFVAENHNYLHTQIKES
jgi:hypothetical protein